MSEFKFACPVCGQHITADAKASGSKLECPTCFQKIVVPQAPSSQDSKLILSAAQANKPRPVQMETGADSRPPRSSALLAALPSLLLLLALAAAGTAAFVWHDKLFKGSQGQGGTNVDGSKIGQTGTVARTVYPIPTNITWSLDVSNTIPDGAAVGSIHGEGFLCERATLTGGNLTLRQGPRWPPDLGLTVVLFAQQGEELSGKTVVVTPERQPPLPRVILRWKNQQEKGVTRSYTNGYALKIVFGQAAGGRIPGKLYVATPDSDRSFAGGTFNAEIHKPPPPKPH